MKCIAQSNIELDYQYLTQTHFDFTIANKHVRNGLHTFVCLFVEKKNLKKKQHTHFMGEMNENTQKVQIEKRERDRERKQILSKYASKLYKRSLNQRTSDMCKCKQHGCFINK